MEALSSIRTLVPDQRPWRIDWFGDVGYPGSIPRYTQPSIKVSISPIREPRERYLPFRLIETEISEQREAWVPLSSLGMLQVGDIWQNGRQVAKPDYIPETFEDLEISKETVVRIKAGLPIDGHYLLPFSEHPWHQKHTNSYCLEVSTPECRIIIPCMELIRFYFGSCGILLKRLFTWPFKEENYWREKRYDTAKRHLHLKLADGMPMYAVPDLARIATDEHAREAAASIYASCLNPASGGERYPHMFFPFVGKTTLKASGMWLPFGEKAKQTFLVFSLHVCSHPFAFDSLTYDPCERAPWQERNGGQEGERQAQARRSRVRTETVLEDVDPGARKAPWHFLIDDSVRFPDLLRKPIRPREVIAMGSKEAFMRMADGALEKLAFGEGEGSGEARAIDVRHRESKRTVAPPETKLPDFVVVGIARAKAELTGGAFGVEAHPLVLHGETEPVFPLPLVIDEDGVVDQRPMFTEPDGHQRVRRGCRVALCRKGELIRETLIIEGNGRETSAHAVECESHEMIAVVAAVLQEIIGSQ